MSNFVAIGQTFAEMGQFYELKMKPDCHLTFSRFQIATAHRLNGAVRVTLQIFLMISQTVREFWRFIFFSRWRPSAILNY